MVSVISDDGRVKRTQCHILPCKIKYTGPANVSKYFRPTENKNGKSVVYFHGRKLFGHQINLPKNYKGLIIAQQSETTPDYGILEEIEVQGVGHSKVEQYASQETFDAVTVWEHGIEPSQDLNPTILGLSEWIALAELIHCDEAEIGGQAKSENEKNNEKCDPCQEENSVEIKNRN